MRTNSRNRFVQTKKIGLVILALLLLTGCGARSEKTTNDSSVTRENTLKDVTNEDNDMEMTETSEASDTHQNDENSSYGTLEEYLNLEEVKAAILIGQEEGKEEGMDILVYAEGSCLIYEYRYLNYSANEDLLQGLTAEMEEQNTQFQTLANTIKKEANVEEFTLVIRYTDNAGELLIEETFQAS